jgi:hypothetical protein
LISRVLLAIGLAGLMVVTGSATYIYLEGRQSKVAAAPQKPTTAIPSPHAFTLPGTLFLAQSGALYSLSEGRFHQLTAEDGWSQPSLFPDGTSLLAVKRSVLYSDVYILNRFGTVTRQETVDIAPNPTGADPSSYDWAFYPRLSPDEKTLWLAYDKPKFGYDVILTIWAMPLYGSIHQAVGWSSADDYTGGDVQPIPLASGGVIYTKYSYGPDQRLIGQLWYTNRPSLYTLTGHALTDPSEDCRDPALSPSGTEVAMICTYEKQVSYLTIASWNGSSLGPRTIVISNQLVAQPTWAPDGSGIAYLAPGSPDGPFQLWFLPKNAYAPPPPSPIPTPTPTPGGPYGGTLPSPSPLPPPTPIVVKPIQITTDLGFDATSPMAWSP